MTIMNAIKGNLCSSFGIPRLFDEITTGEKNLKFSLENDQPNISKSSVPFWGDLTKPDFSRSFFGNKIDLQGWKYCKSGYRSLTVHRPEYLNLVSTRVIEHWECDISDIHGFTSSKSDLEKFSSTDEMVIANSKEMIPEISLKQLKKNLSHREIRIIHSPGHDHFDFYAWDGRLWLSNCGGSHHFAAAKYIAKRLKTPVKLSGEIRIHSLNYEAINSLSKDFEIFVISDNHEDFLDFLDSMKEFRASFYWHKMPKQFQNSRAILLPRNDSRSMVIAEKFKALSYVDLVRYLYNLPNETNETMSEYF